MDQWVDIVHDEILSRHREISKGDVETTWKCAFLIRERIGDDLPKGTLVALGADGRGRALEMVGAQLERNQVLVFHAMTPPTAKPMREAKGHDGLHHKRWNRALRRGRR